MIGPARTNASNRESARAPYAAPQPAANTRPQNDAGVSQPLVPFVPREFRDTGRRDVTAMPAVQQSHFTPAFDQPMAVSAEWTGDSVAEHLERVVADDAADTVSVTNSAEFVDVGDIDTLTNETSAELPWIDAFAADEPDPEETWPLGEAGKRLDELTESLSSMDASRQRLEKSESTNQADNAAAEAPLPMWNEDEWIDIMPMSMPVPTPLSSRLVDALYDNPDVSGDAEVPAPTVPDGAELTARALESLAARIRSGDVQVPDARPEVAQEALLAGVLASMLGWRQ